MRARATAAIAAVLCAWSAAWAQQQPLPSWNEGSAKERIVAFVQAVTDKAGKDYVAPEERVATFDNDGTLWCEQPLYFQLVFMLEQVKAGAPEHPEWEDSRVYQELGSPARR